MDINKVAISTDTLHGSNENEKMYFSADNISLKDVETALKMQHTEYIYVTFIWEDNRIADEYTEYAWYREDEECTDPPRKEGEPRGYNWDKSMSYNAKKIYSGIKETLATYKSKKRTPEIIRRELIRLGFNSTLINRMSDQELYNADSCDDIGDLEREMTHLAYKYDV